MLTGVVTGGMAGATFYGAGRAVSALKESITKPKSRLTMDLQFFAEEEKRNKTLLSLDEALYKLEKSNLKPGQTVISRQRVLEIVDTYDPVRASSSVYVDSTGRYLVEGHHTTVATTMLGRESGFNMNVQTNQLPSVTNVHWKKSWYEFWKKSIKVVN